jgi:flagellar FliJ protein
LKKFKFKLQPVLHHRQTKEDLVKKELAEVKLLFEKEQRLLGELKEKLNSLQNEFRDKQRLSLDPTEAAAYAGCIEKVNEEIEAQIARLTEIAQEVKKTQERLLEATKDKKVLEKLHDKKYEEFKQEFEKTEQAQIDELATVRHKKDEQW